MYFDVHVEHLEIYDRFYRRNKILNVQLNALPCGFESFAYSAG